MIPMPILIFIWELTIPTLQLSEFILVLNSSLLMLIHHINERFFIPHIFTLYRKNGLLAVIMRE